MRVAVTADPEIPVPPLLYGGAERVVETLVRGLKARGHSVTLFANAASQVPCELVPYAGAGSVSWSDTLKNMRLVARTVEHGGFDVVHSFGRLAYLLQLLPRRIPKIMSYGRWVSARSVILGNILSRGSLRFTSCSRFMIEKVKGLGAWSVIYHGIPLDRYTFCPAVAADAPLIYLGRIEPLKGAHLAIEAARISGRRLIIAGNVEKEHMGYFKRAVEPHLGDRVRYVGPVDDRQKSGLLGEALAFLMPVLWKEPFGLVMAEALACGTPVIAFRNGGSPPEIVEDGMNGFLCDDARGMAECARKAGMIDRAGCRRSAEARFSEGAMVGAYEKLYTELVWRSKKSA